MPQAIATRPMRLISIERRPVYAMLLPIPIVCFVGNLLTDLAYMNSGGNLLWLNFSTWLNAAGLLFGAIAGLVLLIDTVRGSVGWPAFILLLVAWLVEFINALVHARDGWTAVVPAGLILSIIGVLLVLISGWLLAVGSLSSSWRHGHELPKSLASRWFFHSRRAGMSQQIDMSQQVGPNPVLPEPREELIAAVGVPNVVGWKAGETPTVPPGFAVQALATGLSNPRNVYPLANGDVLVVESDSSR